jgi:hypothetical protein
LKKQYEKQNDLTKILQVINAKGDTGEIKEIVGKKVDDESECRSEKSMERRSTPK